MNKNQGNAGSKFQKFVPVILAGGIKATVNPNDIDESKWKHHHGKTAAGVQVNSMQSIQVGDSVLLRQKTGAPAISVAADELEVFVADYKKSPGH